MKNLLVVLFVCISLYTTGNEKYSKENDSLISKDYTYLEKQVVLNKKDTASAKKYAESWLRKAKKEENNQQQAMAYKAIMHLSERKFRMIYADSLLIQAKKTNNDAVIGSTYLTIGAAYYNDKNPIKALDCYVLANNYIIKTKDQYLINKIKYTIAQTKFYLGYYHESIALFLECMNYFEEENETAYLKTLHSISLCYNKLGRFDLCSFYNSLGIKKSTELEIEEMIPYFNNSEGINQYQLKKYNNAIRLLGNSLKEITIESDYEFKANTLFYLGKSYWELKDIEKAISYFHKVNLIIDEKDFIRPELRENYELLIKYYDRKENFKEQLFFINKLLSFDNSLNKNFKYLTYKVHKEYDTKTLILAKQEIENQMISNKSFYNLTVIGLSASMISLIIWHFSIKRRNKQKFEKLMQNSSSKEDFVKPQKNTTISPEVTNIILQNLEKFEKSKKYLEKDMSLTKIATLLNTNTKYASIIIADHRGKKLTNYINDLKIDHIVEILKTQNKFRNYTNKALAEEAGFGSTQIFTKAFNNRNGISPTYFIEELKKQQRET